MRWRVFVFVLMISLGGSGTSKAQGQLTALPDAPKPQPGIVVGTVTDVNNDAVPGATVSLAGPALKDPRMAVSNDNGSFQFNDVEPGTYQVIVSAQGFANWTSPAIMLKPGQYAILPVSKLRIAEALTTITVASPVASSEEIAAEQVKVEEQQRIFGFIPNFYVTYDRNVVPLTPKLKFKLATKALFDPVTVIGVAGFAAINQAADNPNYGQGAKGYALVRAMPMVLSTSWSAAPSCHLFCTRTRGTSIRARAQRSLAFCTQSPAHSSLEETTDSGSRTIRPWVVI